jgi:2-C-methyl-D-erythritol 4-phosphate cytidylyltransferase/2-C-methyl-D-erythritol 2,4-cyclodiphosphate synthase
MDFSAVVVAGGAGRRAGGETPKQWRLLAGKPLSRWSVEALLAAGARKVVVVAPAGDLQRAQAALSGLSRVAIAAGGAERAESVRAGLEALKDSPPAAVLIHDAARPLLAPAHVEALLKALEGADGALPALAMADTVKRAGPALVVEATLDRGVLWRAQTPQAFHFHKIAAAYDAWPGDEAPTDDARVMERAGGRVALIPGDPNLMKATYPEDFAMLETLARPGGRTSVRTGQGLDAHRFGPGEGVWLCGVQIPHDRTLIGHSDADAGLHALTDALLGAIGAGDIGDHFPPTDPAWRGAASELFLRHAARLVRAGGGRIVNVDVTLVCERPKIKPHREAMRARLAEILELGLDRVSVKATTMEGMGFTGREEGLIAQAAAAVEMPD